MKKRKSVVSALKGKLDKLWAAKGKEDAFCAICATLPANERINYSQLHPHHIIGRTHQATRYDIKNRIWLCPHHHTLGTHSAHNNPLWFAGWFKEHYPKIDNYLESKQNEIKIWRVDELEQLVEELK